MKKQLDIGSLTKKEKEYVIEEFITHIKQAVDASVREKVKEAFKKLEKRKISPDEDLTMDYTVEASLSGKIVEKLIEERKSKSR